MSALRGIFERKAIEVAERSSRLPLAVLRARASAALPCRGFEAALRSAGHGRMALIAEVKKASPSKGLLVPDFDHLRIARSYVEAKADAISVLTDEKGFQGSLDYLEDISRLPGRPPLLQKDFIRDDYQVYEARSRGADAVLLIAAALDDATLASLGALARSLGMDALVEVHDRGELERAAAIGASLIGVNNRDLGSFAVRLETSLELAPFAPPGALLVAESGIRNGGDAVRLAAAGYGAMLVGESLVTSRDVAQAARALRSSGDIRGERLPLLGGIVA
jgi:indole-3-glycerol phosphate synthase